ncbi:hypothetical protein JXA85_08165, partial [Candidatus Woesearchaeota archaeon]|nr:hypothetical protein [Candidatus Woesearchaeota archaeon]
YYSRTGTTRKAALLIAKELKADIDEIIDKKPRKGFFGYLTSGRDAMKKKLTTIETNKTPAGYDLVVLGGPVWGWTICPAIRTFLAQNKLKTTALFCTMGGSGSEKFFSECKTLIPGKVLAELALVAKEPFEGNIRDFVKKLK